MTMTNSLPKDSEIAALLPEYTPEGDVTRVLLTDGTELVLRRTMRSTVSALARRRCKDVKLLRLWAGKYTHRRLNNPIAASPDLVLAPVKARRPRVEGDNTMAHINVAVPLSCLPEGKTWPGRRNGRRSGEKGQDTAVINLPGGLSLRTLWSKGTTLSHIDDARRIRAELVREQQESVLRRLKQSL